MVEGEEFNCNTKLLQELLGSDISFDLCEKLLRSSEGQVERAANRYFQSQGAVLDTFKRSFDESEPDQNNFFAPVRKKNKKTLHNSSLAAESLATSSNSFTCIEALPPGAPRKCKKLGDLCVETFSLTSGESIKDGAQISIIRTAPTSYTDKGKFFSSKKHNNIIRFSLQGSSKEIGRIPNEITSWLAPIIDEKYVWLTGVIIDSIPKTSVMQKILVQLQVYLLPEAFETRHEELLDNKEDKKQSIAKKSLQIMMNRVCYFPYDENEDEETQGSISLDQVNSLYDKAQCQNLDLEEYDPKSAMKATLRPYQKQAVTWLLKREELKKAEDTTEMIHPLWKECHFANRDPFYWSPYHCKLSLQFPSSISTHNRCGIVADEMGLGKTIEMLSLLSINHPDRLNDLKNDEIKATLVVCPLSLLSQWESEIRTHTKLTNIYVYYGSDKGKEIPFDKFDVVLTTFQTFSSDFSSGKRYISDVHWYRVVLDEAHFIRNTSTVMFKACGEIKADRRWVVTGTPIVNRIDDLFALVKFLKIEPWSSQSFWKEQISKPFEERNPSGLQSLQGVLEPIVLRRQKSTLGKDGKPLVGLPEKNITVKTLDFSPAERDLYNAIYKRSKTTFSSFLAAGTAMKNYANILELLLRLRQCCDHWNLLVAGLSHIEAKIDSENKQAHTFSDIDTIMDTFMKYTATQKDKCDNNNDGSNNDNINDENIDVNNKNCNKKRGKKTADGAGGEPNLAFALSFMSDLKEGNVAQQECPICLEPPDDMVITPCLHAGCRECLPDVIKQLRACPVCRSPMTPDQLMNPPSSQSEEEINEEVGEIDEKKNSGPEDPSMPSSAKLRALMESVHDIKLNFKDDKCVIFSQFTGMLNLVEKELGRNKLEFVRLDGSLSQAKRAIVLQKFANDKNCRIFLISLRAGGVGLNLTSANHVFLLDPWWNSAIEDQAIDRIHRIGQTKPVMVTKFVIRDTVEENIIKIQTSKKEIVQDALTMNQEERRQERMNNLKMIFSR